MINRVLNKLGLRLVSVDTIKQYEDTVSKLSSELMSIKWRTGEVQDMPDGSQMCLTIDGEVYHKGTNDSRQLGRA